MDYPKSVPNVGLVNGKFVDENTTTGQVGSLIPASWGNAVTSEILNVLEAASIAPDELSNDQLYKAISKIVADSGVTKEDLNQKADKATTLAGYGITDGATKTDITNLLPRTGGALSGRLTLSNGTDDSPELSWKTPSCTANLDLVGSVLRIFAERGGETVFPLQLDAAAKVPYFFGNVAWHAGNFNPAVYLQSAQLPRNTAGANWWRCGDTGLMLQWGTLVATTGGTAAPYGGLLFPMSFAAGALQVLGTAGSNLAAQGVDGSGRGVPVIAFDALTNSGARWRMDSNNGNGISNGATIRWIAIGF